MPLRAVMDTNVLYAAFRSRRGASFEVFRRLRAGEWTAVVSNHLVHEYEEVLKANGPDLGLSLEEADELLNAVCARAEEWARTGTLFSPTLMTSHLHPAVALGVEVLRPGEFLRKLVTT